MSIMRSVILERRHWHVGSVACSGRVSQPYGARSAPRRCDQSTRPFSRLAASCLTDRNHQGDHLTLSSEIPRSKTSADTRQHTLHVSSRTQTDARPVESWWYDNARDLRWILCVSVARLRWLCISVTASQKALVSQSHKII